MNADSKTRCAQIVTIMNTEEKRSLTEIMKGQLICDSFLTQKSKSQGKVP